MCLGGGSKSNTATPPPQAPTRFEYRTTETDQQRRANQAVNTAQAPVINSTTASQAPASPQTFGAELGATAQ